MNNVHSFKCLCCGKIAEGRYYKYYFGNVRSWTTGGGLSISVHHTESTCLGQEQAFICNRCASERISTLRCDNMYLNEETRTFRVMWLATLGTGGLAVAGLYAMAQSSWILVSVPACWGIWMFYVSFSYLNRKWVSLDEAIDRNIGQIELLAGLIGKKGSGLTIWTEKSAQNIFETLWTQKTTGEVFRTGSVYTTQEQKG